MIKIQWEKRFEVGHARIDAEHRTFVDLIMSVDDCVRRGVDKNRLFRQLDEVGKYTQFHFVSEENVMIDYDYPDYKRHAEMHVGLLRGYMEYMLAVESGTADMESMLKFLYTWFMHHTVNEDARIARYVSGGTPPVRAENVRFGAFGRK